jgi:2-keto-3-deoxy-L-rhamnonate aldolase RhmA
MTLRERVRSRAPLIGTFIKSPAIHSVEIAGLVGLDFVVLDAEHAPFSLDALDRCLLASRAARIAALIRIPEISQTFIQQALDLGGAGILVPHVAQAEEAQAAVAYARFAGGRRGYSNSTRAGAFGAYGMTRYLQDGDANAAVVVQIEDQTGVENASDIAAIPGVDALFIGRADLTVDMGKSDPTDPAVVAAVNATITAAAEADSACGIFLSDVSDVPAYLELGTSFFVIGSDQSMMRAGWSAAKSTFVRGLAST